MTQTDFSAIPADSPGERRLAVRTDCRTVPDDIRQLRAFLDSRGTFHFPVLSTGLFSAASLSEDAVYTGYHNVWVRDNVHIAHAHLVHGQAGTAARCVLALARFFLKHRRRFEAVVADPALAESPMNRPHVRFNGETLEENAETWSHAQNDALGYFLWLACKLIRAGHLSPTPDEWAFLALFPRYFQAIRYWQDEDSGHWEETRKIEASSIGAVVAGLRELRCLPSGTIPAADDALTDHLLARGEDALRAILPYECVQPGRAMRRRADGALLFLIYPLEVVESKMADGIIEAVETHLLGERGISRYEGDSFWCADYKELQTPELRTSDVSADMSGRDALLIPGQEAQWCIFDPILSAVYGRRYLATGEQESLRRQAYFLNRSLSQLTGPGERFPEYRCPELYYLEHGRRVPNDVTPLMWTQANLSLALDFMEQSLNPSVSAVADPPSRPTESSDGFF